MSKPRVVITGAAGFIGSHLAETLLDLGYAAGGLLAGLPTLLEMAVALSPLAAMKASLVLFCVLYLASAALYARLPDRVGEAAPSRLRDLSPESRPIIAKISALFFVDAFAGGFIGYLASRGVSAQRMKTISYGKERPVAVCDDISCWSQNRRAVTALGGAGS